MGVPPAAAAPARENTLPPPPDATTSVPGGAPLTATFSNQLSTDLEERIGGLLDTVCRADLRLATAESCTGGLLASILTDVEGCSHAFDRGFVVYTDEAKREVLGVPADLLAEHGAVSQAVARAMAEGALARSKADIALSVTGFAGPTRTGEEGLVHFGCARSGRRTLHREAHYGPLGRGGVRLACLETAVEMLKEML